ncbi:MAG: transcriptional regulator, partial [Bacteroides cellulosilyticus]|nr:transcriptional regulator [Bacteroides cellulosilyticus]
MKIRFLLFLLAFALARPAYAVWHRQVFNYTHRDYGAATQNWMIEQQENGWIYVANNNGLLEYDGENWALYPVTGHKIRSLKKSGDGRIYIGAINELGYFEPDRGGGLRYTSLAHELRKTVHIGVIRNVLLNAGRVYFQDDRYIVYLENGELHTLDSGGTIATSAVINQQFMAVTDEGLAAVADDGLHLLPESEQLGKLKVVKLLPHKDRMLVVTRFNGLYTYHPQEGLRPYRTSVDAYIRKNGAICAARLGSRIAIGTVQDGVCVLDLETDRSQILST